MTYGFSTTKTASGFEWAISRTTWNEVCGKSETVVVRCGSSESRAKALGAAKRWVLFFRRGESL